MTHTYAPASARSLTRPCRRGNKRPATRRSGRVSRARQGSALEYAVLLLLAVLLVVGVLATSPRPAPRIRTTAVQVEAGDTLWTLASRHPMAGRTTAQTADMIASVNRISSGRVRAGATLLVPRGDDEPLSVASR